MDIYLIKTTNENFVPAYDSDRENSVRFPPGEIVKANITKPRNVGFHKKYFAMLNLMYQNQDHFDYFENFRSYYQMRAGFYKIILVPQGRLEKIKIKRPTGELHWPTSISFANMDQLEFENVYNRVLDRLLEDIPMDRVDIEKELVEFM